MIYRVHYRISGWVEVEADDADEALAAVSDYTPSTSISETVGTLFYEFDEAEPNP